MKILIMGLAFFTAAISLADAEEKSFQFTFAGKIPYSSLEREMSPAFNSGKVTINFIRQANKQLIDPRSTHYSHMIFFKLDDTQNLKCELKEFKYNTILKFSRCQQLDPLLKTSFDDFGIYRDELLPRAPKAP